MDEDFVNGSALLMLPMSNMTTLSEPLVVPSLTTLLTFGLFYVVCNITGIFGNILVIVMIITNKTFHQPPYVIMANLAVVDTVHLIGEHSFVPANMFHTYFTFQPAPSWYSDNCAFFGAIGGIALNCQSISMVAIAVNRYIMVIHAPKYKKLFTMRRTFLCVAMIYVYGVLVKFATSADNWYDARFFCCKYKAESSVAFEIFLGLRIVFTVTLLVFCYSRTFWKAYQCRNQAVQPDNSQQQHIISNKEFSLLVQFFVICLVYLLFMICFMLHIVILNTTSIDPQTVNYVLLAVMGVNSSINPPVYLVFNKQLRARVFSLIKRRH